MNVGALGKIVFRVSDKVVQTINGFSLSGGARVAKHSVHLGPTLTEFTGRDSDTISFSVRVTKALGANPDTMLKIIEDYVKSGKPVALTIGTKQYGYRWIITKYKMTAKNHDRKGNIFDADISLSLQEYGRG